MPADLGWGDSHSGKSTALEALAYYLYEKTGKKTRLYIGDGGVETYNRRGLVDEGIIEPWDYRSQPEPMVTVNMIGDLYFPKDYRNLKSKLVPPPSNLSDTHCLMIVEGGAVMGQYMMESGKGSMSWHAAHGTGFGGIKGDEQDKLRYVATTEYADYNEQGLANGLHAYRVQQKLVKVIKQTTLFPGLVFWTSHPTIAADKGEGGTIDQYGKVSGKSIIGPDFGGKAQASLISKDFGATLHFDTVTIETKSRDELTRKDLTRINRQYRLYTTRHQDPEQKVLTTYLAGHRMGDGMPEFFTSKEPGDSLLQYYQQVKTMVAAARKPTFIATGA